MASLTSQDLASRSLPMAKLGFKKRQSLPSSDFALPGKGEGKSGKGSGSYPIPDESHARNALARVSQHGTPEEKAAVRRKVRSKFPGIHQGGDNPPAERKESVGNGISGGPIKYTHSRAGRG
jgi:hypothetical protein